MTAPLSDHLSESPIWMRDLASVACQAATELDDLILKKQVSLDAVRRLTDQLSAKVVSGAVGGPVNLVDPTTTVVISRALRDSEGSDPNYLQDVASVARRVISQMGELPNATADESRTADAVLNMLRSFCLAVSKHAAAMTPTPFERREHPFRR